MYALGAVGYQALSGVRPVEAPTRTEEDRLLPLAVVARRPVSRGLARAVDEALRVFGRDRPRDLASWRELLEAPDGRPPDGPQRVRAAAPPRGGPSAPVPSPPTPPGPAPPQPSPPAPAAAAGRAPEYAGFGRRLLAFCLDSLVTAFGAFLVSLVLALVLALGAAFGEGAAGAAGPPDSEPSEAIGAFVLLAAVALAWLHEALLVSGSRQATLGKMAVGIVVTDLRGRRISFLRATGRWCGKCVSGLVLAIGYLVQPFTERRQALHDIMAGCLVLRRSRAGGGSPR